MAVRAPPGYAGNLDDEQVAALASIKEKLQQFAKERADAPDAKNPPAAANPDPKAPLVPGTADEEIDQANKLIASDSDMSRFLRARQWDVTKATEMATNSIKWRASVKPWAITPEMIPNALPSGVWRWAGYTKSGMPILHVDCANWIPTSYYSVDEYVRYIAYVVEGAVNRMGPGVERLFLIYWIPGLNAEMMKPTASKCAKVLMATMQDQYPERLGAAITCNAPALFAAMWKLCSGWIDPVTTAKFQFAPKNAIEVLSRHIDPSVLQKDIGGEHEVYPCPSKSFADELAEFSKSTTPPSASDSSAIRGCTDETIISGDMNTVFNGQSTIVAGSIYSVQVQLEENTTSVSWSFDEAKQREFNFGYKVVMPCKKAPPAASAMFGGGMFGGGYGGGAAAMVAAKGNTLLMSKDPEPMDFSSGKVSGSIDIQKTWAGGTLNLSFDNSAARLFRMVVNYEVKVEAKEQ